MLKRILVAIPIVAVIALGVILQGWAIAVLVIAFALISQFEIVRAFRQGGKQVNAAVSYLYAIGNAVLFVALLLQSFELRGMQSADAMLLLSFLLFVVLTVVAFFSAVLGKRHQAEDVAYTTFSMIYPQLFFALWYALVLSTVTIGNDASTVGYAVSFATMLMIFLPAMLCDTFAYFFGRFFGKKKLCPDISPKKTVVGSVGGIVGGVVGALLVWVLELFVMVRSGLPFVAFDWNAGVIFMLFGAALAVVSQFGDLSASLLKRNLGIKDFGKLLPGHGGIVDRMDSILFCLPVVYLGVFANAIPF